MKKKASPFIPELLKRYAKGLDNGATESYSKLSRSFLGGRPWRFLSRPLYFTLVGTPFQAQPPTFQRQFDKMQISFVSLTTIGFSAYPSFFRSSSVKPLLIFACIALHGTSQKTSSFPSPFLATGIPPPCFRYTLSTDVRLTRVCVRDLTIAASQQQTLLSDPETRRTELTVDLTCTPTRSLSALSLTRTTSAGSCFLSSSVRTCMDLRQICFSLRHASGTRRRASQRTLV